MGNTGALREHGQTAGYYNIAAASYGLQIGVQSFGYALFLMNDKLVVDNCVFLEGKIPAEGPIELQVHGTPLWFRNIFVKELNAK